MGDGIQYCNHNSIPITYYLPPGIQVTFPHASATESMMNHHTDTGSDATLVALVLAGERETFTPLLLRYYTSVARLCRRLLGPTPEAQDIAQEAALQAFLRLGELQDAARFGAWLHAIAANLARMELRRRRTLSLDAMTDGAAMIVLWAAGPHTPEEVHAARELHDTIVAALSDLSD